MPIFSAGLSPYPSDAVFMPTPTLDATSTPKNAFFFAIPEDSVPQYPFDGCGDYNLSLFKDDIERMHFLLMRYELLCKFEVGQRLAGEYYPVPWLLVPSNIAADVTIKLTVSPYSVYDENPASPAKELRDAVEPILKTSTRVIELSVPGSSDIKAYWGSGTNTTIDEKKLAKAQTVRIKIPKSAAPYVTGTDIEHRQDVLIQTVTSVLQPVASVLGKLRLTFCKALSQDVCFVNITQPILNGPFEARILSPSAIPLSLEDGTGLDISLVQALKPYCIDIVSLNGAQFLDSTGNVLISTQTSVALAADLKPPPGQSDPDGYIDNKLAGALFSKLKTYRFTGSAGARAIEKVIVVVILPFYVDAVTGGFTPRADRSVVLNQPLRSYLYPEGKAIRETQDALPDKVTKWSPKDGNTWAVTFDQVPNPYSSSTLAHEVLHALQLRHTFLDHNDRPQTDHLSAIADEMKKKNLTEFGEREPGPTPKGQNIFELMRDADLRSAVSQLPNFGPQPPPHPAPPEVWDFMTWLNENVLFPKHATKKNYLDYSDPYPFLKPLRVTLGPNTPTPTRHVFVSVIAPPQQRYLFRYQWELARATVQYLSSFLP